MRLEATERHERLAAVLANVRLLARVVAEVDREGRLGQAAVVADGADEPPVVGVDAQVDAELRVGRESARADLARVRLLARVLANVDLELGPVREHLFTKQK